MIYLGIPNLQVLVTSTSQTQFSFLSGPQDLITNATFIGWVTVISLGVGVLSLLVGLGVSIWLYIKSKRIKLITFEVLNETPLMQVQPQPHKGTIEVLYYAEDTPGNSTELSKPRVGRELKKPSFVSLEVKNSGNEDVVIWRESDEGKENSVIPIEFEFKNREVITLTGVKFNPPTKEINANILTQYLNKPSPKPSFLDLPHCLLKKKESILLGILSDGPGRGVQKHGELINGEIENSRDLERKKRRTLIIIGLTLGGGTIAIMVGLAFLFPSVVTILAGASGSTIAIIGLLAATLTALETLRERLKTYR